MCTQGVAVSIDVNKIASAYLTFQSIGVNVMDFVVVLNNI